METKKELSLSDGAPNVWKIEDGEKPVKALERFFTALDESRPASLQSLPCGITIASSLKQTESELSKMKTQLATLKAQMATLQARIGKKEEEVINWKSTEEVWAQYTREKMEVAEEWRRAGLISDFDILAVYMIQHVGMPVANDISNSMPRTGRVVAPRTDVQAGAKTSAASSTAQLMGDYPTSVAAGEDLHVEKLQRN